MITKTQVSGKASLTPESELFFFLTILCSLPGKEKGWNYGSQLLWNSLLCWDVLASPVQHREWDAFWVVGAFSHDHPGVTSLSIRFNADTSLEVHTEVQVDNLTQKRPTGNKIHSEQRWRSLFMLLTWVSLDGHCMGCLWIKSIVCKFFMKSTFLD